MSGWLESIAGPDYAAALMWTLAALIVLLVLLVVIRIARAVSVGTFVAGGRNRKTRLAVMDATAVDSQRRLVLVRRDDVEHLILIGGPTDIVVEQNIRLIAPARRASEDDAHSRHAAPAAAEQPRPQPQPVLRPVAAPRPAPTPPPAPVTPAARPEPRFEPAATAPAAPASPPRPVQTAPAVPPPASGVQPMRPVDTPTHVTAPDAPADTAISTPRPAGIDERLLQELEVSLESQAPAAPAPAPQSPVPQPSATSAADISLDEEMSRLLNDLASKR